MAVSLFSKNFPILGKSTGKYSKNGKICHTWSVLGIDKDN